MENLQIRENKKVFKPDRQLANIPDTKLIYLKQADFYKSLNLKALKKMNKNKIP
jgi:hypothetical protein